MMNLMANSHDFGDGLWTFGTPSHFLILIALFSYWKQSPIDSESEWVNVWLATHPARASETSTRDRHKSILWSSPGMKRNCDQDIVRLVTPPQHPWLEAISDWKPRFVELHHQGRRRASWSQGGRTTLLFILLHLDHLIRDWLSEWLNDWLADWMVGSIDGSPNFMNWRAKDEGLPKIFEINYLDGQFATHPNIALPPWSANVIRLENNEKCGIFVSSIFFTFQRLIFGNRSVKVDIPIFDYQTIEIAPQGSQLPHPFALLPPSNSRTSIAWASCDSNTVL